MDNKFKNIKHIIIVALIALTGVPCWGVTNVASNEQLLHAAKTGDLNELTQALQDGAEVDATDKDGHSALWLAKKHGHKAIVAELIKKGAAKTEKTAGIFSIEFIKKNRIAFGAFFTVIMGILYYKWYWNTPFGNDEIGRTPDGRRAANAAEHGQQGNNIHHRAANYEFVQAVRNNNLDEVNRALERGADINLINVDRQEVLLAEASAQGNARLVQTLINHNVNVRAADEYGRTPLVYATVDGHDAIVDQLILAGANVNEIDADGLPILVVPVVFGHIATVQTLIRHNANVNAVDGDGISVLMHAAQDGNAQMVQLLLDAGADATIPFGNQTALDMALQRGDQAVIRILQNWKPMGGATI